MRWPTARCRGIDGALINDNNAGASSSQLNLRGPPQGVQDAGTTAEWCKPASS
jgi:hypothetical protein